ncbi:MAG: glycogen-binding domain-containing protein [Gracilimonas sp.]|uniref:hypothetical protein n=1 Tax=Gracilimonas sp. TaxID=1974203 RepID=UPI00375031B8|nr:glycogen-binding domain-containing protein [Gracilimonas sp.]
MNKQELLRKYLDHELSAYEEKEALHAIADDSELRSSLRFELFLRQSFSDPSFDRKSFEVPEGFSNKVMMQIDQLEEQPQEVEQIPLIPNILSWLQSIFTPRNYQLSPALIGFAVTLVILIPALFLYLNQSNTDTDAIVQSKEEVATQTVSDNEELVWVRFIYVDENANKIAIAGDFNDWQPYELTEQQVNGKDVWTGFFAMPRGENKYMFVVNGENWVTDPLATMYEDDGFGNKNAIIYL